MDLLFVPIARLDMLSQSVAKSHVRLAMQVVIRPTKQLTHARCVSLAQPRQMLVNLLVSDVRKAGSAVASATGPIASAAKLVPTAIEKEPSNATVVLAISS